MKPHGQRELGMSSEHWAAAMVLIRRGFALYARAIQAGVTNMLRVIRAWNEEADAAAATWSPEIPGGVARQGVLALVAAARRRDP